MVLKILFKNFEHNNLGSRNNTIYKMAGIFDSIHKEHGFFFKDLQWILTSYLKCSLLENEK